MSNSNKEYYPHPYLTSDGLLGISIIHILAQNQRMDVWGQALNVNIPKLYHTVLNDKSSSPKQIENATIFIIMEIVLFLKQFLNLF